MEREGGDDKELKILVVEDLEEHVEIIKRILEDSNLNTRIFVTRDGEEALDFLYNRGNYSSREEYPRPDVILLDLRLPKLDGLDVLERIKREPELRDIPVVVLTSSKRDEDLIRAYEGGAKSYLLKSAFIVLLKNEAKRLLDAIISLV